MVSNLRGLSVFIASPGGLEAERKQFFETISKFNADDAHESGLTFIPKGHELAYPGAGRPQGLINEQVRASDYCLIVFWDKWGMSPDHQRRFTSGTEEEYEVAMDCLEDKAAPMRDIVVLFKGVDDRQMSDPGSQLQKVLDFKKRLESERRVLYRTFDTLHEFADELQRLLSKWSRDWSSGQAAEKAALPPPRVTPGTGDPDLVDATLLERAKAAAKSGQTTLAHQLYTQATTGAYDREAWTQYLHFLRRSERYSLAQTFADKMVSAARDASDHAGAAEALSNIGMAKRSQGHRSAAIQYFDQALKELLEWESEGGPLDEILPTRAFILDNKGLTWRRMSGHLDEAVSAIQQAMDLHRVVHDVRGEGHALRNMGVVWAQLGALADSEEALRGALRNFEEADYERAQAMTHGALGETLELQGRWGEAIEEFELALSGNTNLNNASGKSMNTSQIARVSVARGDLKSAEDYAQMCLAIGQETGRPESQAAGLAAVGRVQLYQGDFAQARETLLDAQNIYYELDQPVGLAATSLDLALAYHKAGDTHASQDAFARAEEALEKSPHYGLSQFAEEVRQQLETPHE